MGFNALASRPAPRAALTYVSALRREKCNTPSMPPAKASAAAREDGHGNGAIDHGRAHHKAVGGKIAGEVAGAVGAGKIEERRSGSGPLRDETREVGHFAVGGGHIGEAGRAHRLRAALADRERGQRSQLREAFVLDDGRRRVGAGDQDRRPRSAADLGIFYRLDAQERGDNHLVAAGTECGGGALRIGLGPRHQKPHGQICTKKSVPARSFNSRPASAPSSAACSRPPSRKTSNASLPSGLTMMPRKRTISPPTLA